MRRHTFLVHIHPGEISAFKSLGFLVGLATLACLAAWPAAASAGYWSMVGGSFVDYEGEPGEANQVSVEFDGSYVTVTDTAGVRPYSEYYACELYPEFGECPGGTYTPGGDPAYQDPEPCEKQSATSFRCPYNGGTLGLFYLNDGNDSFAYVGSAPPLPASASNVGEPLGIFGGPGDDVLAGSPYNDELDGDYESRTGEGSGSDQVHGGDGDDIVSADRLDTAANQNLLTGRPGNDELDASNGTNSVNTGPGDDEFSGGDGRDVVDGAEDQDDLYGGSGPDLLRGGAGNDSVEGGPDRDVAHGDAGNDYLAASFHGGCGGPDKFVGGPDRDRLYAYCGEPTILFRDGTRDTGECKKKVRPVRLRLDRKDELTGPCERYRAPVSRSTGGRCRNPAEHVSCPLARRDERVMSRAI